MVKKFWLISSIVASALLLGFIIVSVVLSSVGMAPLGIDTSIANWAYSVRGEMGGATYWFFRIITELGYTYVIVALVVVMAIIWKFKSKAWFFAGTVLITWLFQKLLKIIFMRPRPDEAMWWMQESSTSFPSGHSMMAACVFILLAYFIISSPQVKVWVKYVIGSLCTFAVIIVPISRIILGVHYFTDVLGGVFIGAFMAVLGIIAYHIYLHFMEKKKGVKQPEGALTENKKIAKNNN